MINNSSSFFNFNRLPNDIQATIMLMSGNADIRINKGAKDIALNANYWNGLFNPLQSLLSEKEKFELEGSVKLALEGKLKTNKEIDSDTQNLIIIQHKVTTLYQKLWKEWKDLGLDQKEKSHWSTFSYVAPSVFIKIKESIQEEHDRNLVILAIEIPEIRHILLSGGNSSKSIQDRAAIARSYFQSEPPPNLNGIEVIDLSFEKRIFSKKLGKLTVISPEMMNILKKMNLGYLYMRDNALNNLPKEIGDLLLTRLDISGNQFKELPIGIAKLTQLKELNIGRNQLTVIPGNIIENLLNLTDLYMHSNRLSKLPPQIELLQKLSVLSIESNNIEEFPNFSNKIVFPNMQVLSAKNNQFKEIPKWIGGCTEMCDLNFSCNAITSIPKEIERLKRMHTFSVSNNQISELPNGIAQLPYLMRFYASNNNLQKFPKIIAESLSLQVVHLYNNPFCKNDSLFKIIKGCYNFWIMRHIHVHIELGNYELGNCSISIETKWKTGKYSSKYELVFSINGEEQP